MRVTPKDIAAAFVDMAQTMDDAQLPALADATAEVLERQGLMRFARIFPHIVRRLWLKKTGAVSAELQTKEGKSPDAAEIASLVEKAVARTCYLTESADGSLIGGAVLTVGDERFDYSLSATLRDFANRLNQPVSLPS